MIDLDAIEARYARTTGGPWAYEHCGEGLYCVGLTEPPAVGLVEDVYDEERGEYAEKPDVVEFVAEFHGDDAADNARFTAAARTDVPALVAEVRRLRAIIEGRETAPTVTEALRVGAPRRATVRITDGTSRTFTAWPVREGWHHAPPCSESQPVYATPCDAALALARAIGLSVVDAVEVLP